MSTRGVDTHGEDRADVIREGALIHIDAGEAITFETLLTGAEEVSYEVGTHCPWVACTHHRTLIYILAMAAICYKTSLTGASVGPDGVEACGIDMARVVFTLVHINTVHVDGRAVVTDPTGALI